MHHRSIFERNFDDREKFGELKKFLSALPGKEDSTYVVIVSKSPRLLDSSLLSTSSISPNLVIWLKREISR